MINFQKTAVAVILMLSSVSLWASNIQITKGPEITSRDIAGKKITVTIDLSWDNSWNLARPKNHDAAWVFMKYRVDAGVFKHANLVKADDIVAMATDDEGVIEIAQKYGTSRVESTDSTVTTGVFLYRANEGSGKVSLEDVGLVWDITGTGIEANTVLSVRVFAIEMVYVPEGAFHIGDEQSNNYLCKIGDTMFPSLTAPLQGVGPVASVNNNRPGNIVPVVTAADARFTASSQYSTTYVPWMAFRGYKNGAASYSWHSVASNNTWHWLQVDLTESKTVNWGLFAVNNSSYDPRGFYVAGSDDAVTWTGVHGTMGYFDLARSYKFGGDYSSIPVAFDNPGSYRYYRFYFYAMNSYILVANLQLFDSPATEINRITSEKEFMYYTGGNNLATTTANYATYFQPVSKDYPKGYKGFYVMKHEVTQSAYADFLNCLAWDQQVRLVYSPTSTGILPSSNVGTMYGATVLTAANSRMNLKIREKGVDGPAVFGCSLKTADWTEEDWNAENNGGNVPMFHLAWTDIAAYLDWACLRPMTELEYEKACRGDQKRMYNEYAWGQPYLPSRVSGVNDKNLPTEDPIPAVANYAQPEGGSLAAHSAAIANYWPVRAGSFARSETTREEAGAAYWGILNLSDNVPERVINISTVQGRAYTGEHGDGNIRANGLADVLNWPSLDAPLAASNARALGTGYKGIDVNALTIYVPRTVSYRGGIDAANYNQNHRDYWTGCRGVRTAE